MYVTAPLVNLETDHIRKNLFFVDPENNSYIINIDWFNDFEKDYDMQ
jgi:hypothetical protein